jgi:hypothetical protein
MIFINILIYLYQYMVINKTPIEFCLIGVFEKQKKQKKQ